MMMLGRLRRTCAAASDDDVGGGSRGHTYVGAIATPGAATHAVEIAARQLQLKLGRAPAPLPQLPTRYPFRGLHVM